MRASATLFSLTLALGIFASPAHAALSVGDKAPDFAAQASQGGKAFTFTLDEALKKGPVVLYFYPAAFTKGCTVEAHDFAEAIPKFEALGASVIGISRDGLEKLKKFSVSECRSAFPVAADPDGKITASYDAGMPVVPMAKRVSYVIAPDHRIALSYSAMSPDEHVEKTLRAVQTLHDTHP